jgi:hypothetical protein
LRAGVSDFIPQFTGSRMTRDKHEPIEALVPIARNELDAVRWLHFQRLNEAEPVAEDGSSDGIIRRADINVFPPAGCESIEGAACSFNIPTEVTLKILHADGRRAA